MKLTKTTINRLIILSIFAAVFAITLVLATFFDLKINTAMYKPDSFFGQVVSNIGEMPAYAAIFFIFVIFFQNSAPGGKRYWLQKVLSGILLIVAAYAFVSNIFSNLSTSEVLYQPAYIVFFAAIISVFSVWATNNISKELMRKLALFALFLLIVVALSQAFVWVLKNIFQRMRFRNMADGMGFTPWYVIHLGEQGRESLIAAGSIKIDDAFKSFPSGHTANSACLFSVIFLPSVFPKLKRFKPLLFAVAMVWTVMVALSRIVVGAHFLSDVLVGGSVTLAITLAAKWTLEGIFKKKGFDPTFITPYTGRKSSDSIVVSVGDFELLGDKNATNIRILTENDTEQTADSQKDKNN